jgi:DNA-binding NarL/FixJ family response regulator
MHVLIVEDHALVREGFRMILESMGLFQQVRECGSLSAALAAAGGHGDALGLLVLDLGLPDAIGLEGLERVVAGFPTVPVIVVSGGAEGETIREALARGARGYVPKNSSGAAFRAAVEAVLRGELYVPPQLLSTGPATQSAAPSAGSGTVMHLTPRQEDVLLLVARGLANKEIAERLDMSPATVRVHVTALFKALRVENRTQAAISPVAQRLLANRGR